MITTTSSVKFQDNNATIPPFNNKINELPNEILVKISNYLDVKDIESLTLTNKHFNSKKIYLINYQKASAQSIIRIISSRIPDETERNFILQTISVNLAKEGNGKQAIEIAKRLIIKDIVLDEISSHLLEKEDFNQAIEAAKEASRRTQTNALARITESLKVKFDNLYQQDNLDKAIEIAAKIFACGETVKHDDSYNLYLGKIALKLNQCGEKTKAIELIEKIPNKSTRTTTHLLLTERVKKPSKTRKCCTVS